MKSKRDAETLEEWLVPTSDTQMTSICRPGPSSLSEKVIKSCVCFFKFSQFLGCSFRDIVGFSCGPEQRFLHSFRDWGENHRRDLNISGSKSVEYN